MAPPPAKSRPVDAVIGAAVAGFIRLVEKTSRPPPLMDQYTATLLANHPMIIAMWHGQFMLLPTLSNLGIPVRAMLALHRDAEGLAHALRHYGIELIRGAGASAKGKDRGGAHAFRAAVAALENGFSVAMTADVPPGPARKVGHGIVTLAKVSGRPILPIAMASSRYWSLPTWSRMTVNLPGSRLGASFGSPIHVPADASPAQLEVLRREVEIQMNIATADAYNRAEASQARATPLQALTASGERTSPGIRLRMYAGGSRLFGAIGAGVLLKLRARRGKEDQTRTPERFGIASRVRPPGQLAWIHAASVGESMAVLPLINGLRAARPDLSVLLTTGTVTSAELVAARLSSGCIHQYVPLDAPQFTSRMLDHWQPDLGVLVESEIWPNLILQATGRGIPLALVNARMSKRSFRRWRAQGGLSRALFGRFAAVLAQSREYGDHLAALGAPKVKVIGNLKFDAPPLPVDTKMLSQYRIALGQRPVFLAASTHGDEERIIADAHSILRTSFPDLVTIIVPRHPERGAEIAEMLAASGFEVSLRSRTPGLPVGNDGQRSGIIIADTLGELGIWFALSPIAFIGKSLSKEGGGHNPIEGIRLGSLILSGPSISNFDTVYRALVAAEGVALVRTSAEIAAAFERLSRDQSAADRMRSAATQVCEKLTGALPETINTLLDLLPSSDTGIEPAPVVRTIAAAG